MITGDSLLFLGTGSSMGVPMIGCDCDVCRSPSPYNKRLRPGALLKMMGKKILIDASPDLRYQVLKNNIRDIDGVILTHAHHDHSGGIDDLRAFYLKNKKSIPCLLSEETAKEIKIRFQYMFVEQPAEIQLIPRMELIIFKGDSGNVTFLDIPIRYFSYEQLNMKVNGFRIGHFAFVTDIKSFSDKIFEELKGVKILILSALRYTPSHMHLSIDEAIEIINKINPEQTWLIHTAHELEYEKANSYLPSHIRMAYDGLEIKI